MEDWETCSDEKDSENVARSGIVFWSVCISGLRPCMLLPQILATTSCALSTLVSLPVTWVSFLIRTPTSKIVHFSMFRAGWPEPALKATFSDIKAPKAPDNYDQK
ncbi:hypothetical protein ARMGADRAFT_115271 [Armillaria gallica]|uniref:Uncharacterized protein n=1 Tax=Armillaria gallica TaxID=47427 RepID=A0A2H3E0H3_ARMGA|nr:hypothetical protein ARMGADRAFT_115271 [Armillaria gallica]